MWKSDMIYDQIENEIEVAAIISNLRDAKEQSSAGERESRRKKKVSLDFFLGHTVKSRMTVIRISGWRAIDIENFYAGLLWSVFLLLRNAGITGNGGIAAAAWLQKGEHYGNFHRSRCCDHNPF